MVLDILFQNKDVVVINKPPLIHSLEHKTEPEHISSKLSIATLLCREFPETLFASVKVGESGLVQRLDFETSGVIIAARNRVSWNELHHVIQNKNIKKQYLCVVEGHPLASSVVEGFIGSRAGRRRSSRVFFSKTEFPRSTWSRSHVLLEKKFTNYSLIKVVTSTGSRHQVRLHLATLGHPLLGDIKYGSQKETKEFGQSFPSFFLHAWSVEFLHPVLGIPTIIEAPLSIALRQFLKLSTSH